MSLNVNIMFGGNCRKAVIFYSNVFGLEKPLFQTYGEVHTSFDDNVQMSEKSKNLIMFASLKVEDTVIIFSDMPDNFEFNRGNSFGITLIYDSKDKAKDIFNKLSENGQVFVPLADIPGQGSLGMLGDQFNIMWTIKSY